MIHGRASSYVNHRCRCTACTAAATAYQQTCKARRSAERESGREFLHGVSGYINWQCRCEECLNAWREYKRAQVRG